MKNLNYDDIINRIGFLEIKQIYLPEKQVKGLAIILNL